MPSASDFQPTLVTGATGLLGNNVVRRLCEQGRPVRALVRPDADPRPLADLEVEIAHGDVRDAAAVSRAASGVGLVVHAAAMVQIGRTRLERFRAVNVEGTRHVARAAIAADARLVHVSSTDAIGIKSLDEPADEETPFDATVTTPYMVTKHEAEQVILDEVDRGLEAVIVNPGYMLGPWDWKPSSGQMLLHVARGRALIVPAGYFSVADVRDVADGVLAAAEKGRVGRRYILAGETMSYYDGWRLFADVTGGRKPIRILRPWGAKTIGWVGDWYGRLSGVEPEFNSGALSVANRPRNYSSARARAELGYQTRSVRESVVDAWNWFRENGYA